MKLHGRCKVPFVFLELLALVVRCNSRSDLSHTVPHFARSLAPNDVLGKEVDADVREVSSTARRFLGLQPFGDRATHLNHQPRWNHAAFVGLPIENSTQGRAQLSLLTSKANFQTAYSKTRKAAMKVDMGQIITAWLTCVIVVFVGCVGVIAYGRMNPSTKGAAFRKTDREVEKMEARLKHDKEVLKRVKSESNAELASQFNDDLGISISSIPEAEVGVIPAQDTADIGAALNDAAMTEEVQSMSAASSPSRLVPQQDDDNRHPPTSVSLKSTSTGKLQVPPLPALKNRNSPAVSAGGTPASSPRTDRLAASGATSSPAPSSTCGRSPRPSSSAFASARTPRSEADLEFEKAVEKGDYFRIETSQLVEVMGLSGMALLEMDASSGISGVKLLFALPCIAMQAWFLQLALLYYMARRCCRLSGEGGLDGALDEPPKDVPFVIIFAAIYLHFVNCVNDLPFSFSILRHVGELHNKKSHVAVALASFLIDGIVVPFTSLVVGAFYLCTSASVSDVILNSCAVAFISSIDNWILSLNGKLNEASGENGADSDDDEDENPESRQDTKKERRTCPCIYAKEGKTAEGMKVFIPVNRTLMKFMVWLLCVVPIIPTLFSLVVAYAGLIILKL